MLIFDVVGIEKDRFCEHPLRKDIPTVYLTINPISTISWLGTVTQRQLVMNWKWPEKESSGNTTDNQTVSRTESKGDWIGLFNMNVSNGINKEGKQM